MLHMIIDFNDSGTAGDEQEEFDHGDSFFDIQSLVVFVRVAVFDCRVLETRKCLPLQQPLTCTKL